MPNGNTKRNGSRKRGKKVLIRLFDEEHADASSQAERDEMTVADVIRERCGWKREDGIQNRNWTNGATGKDAQP